MSDPVVIVEKDGAVLTVTLNRPEKRNSMIPEFWDELPAIVEELDAGALARAIVISSTGPHFSAGLDLSSFDPGSGMGGLTSEEAQERRRQHGASFYQMVRHMQHTFRDIVEAMGGRVLSTVQDDGRDAIARPGQIIHEVGGAIMGSDARTSVLNEFCQSWEVPNLFVTDGACFASNADKNPTLSIMAIAWRASDYIVEQLGQRSIG